jgi:DNA polymerase-3 subunit gamma/tau
MFDRLKEIANLEKINITDDAIAEIVNVSDGGLRDAVGMLDMSTSYSTDQITEDDIYAINGNVSNNEIEYLVDLIIKKQLSTIINLINDYYNTGKDLVKIFEKVIFVMTNKMIKNNDTNICTIIKILTETVEKMKNSSIGKIYLEVALFELFTETVDKVNNIVVEEKVVNVTPVSTETVERKIELKVEEKPKEEIPIKTSTKVVTNDLKKIRVNNTFVEADKKVLTEVKNKWDKLNDYTFDKDKGAIVCELLDATPTAAGANYLILTYNYDSFVEKGNMYIEKYEKVLNELLDLTNKLVFLTNDEWKKIKNEYIENIKNNVKYSYIEETISVLENSEESSMPELNRQSEIVEKANQLFDMSKIEIKGE